MIEAVDLTTEVVDSEIDLTIEDEAADLGIEGMMIEDEEVIDTAMIEEEVVGKMMVLEGVGVEVLRLEIGEEVIDLGPDRQRSEEEVEVLRLIVDKDQRQLFLMKNVVKN